MSAGSVLWRLQTRRVAGGEGQKTRSLAENTVGELGVPLDDAPGRDDVCRLEVVEVALCKRQLPWATAAVVANK